MKLWRTLGISLAVALALLIAVEGSAFALVEQLTLDELTAKAESILVGEVTDITSYQEDEGNIYTLATLSVEQTIKGENGGEVVIKLPGGEVDGLGLRVEDAPSFEPGERTLVFLEEVENAFEVCGWYQGKFTVQDDRVVERGQSLSSFIADIRRTMGIRGASEEDEIQVTITEEQFPIEGYVPAGVEYESANFFWYGAGVWSEKSEYAPTEAFINYSQFANYGDTSTYTVYFYLYNPSGTRVWSTSRTGTLPTWYYTTWPVTLTPPAGGWPVGDWQFGSEVVVALGPNLAEKRCINRVVAVVNPPQITSISPASGPAGTGFPVTITGTNFGAEQGTSRVGFWRVSSTYVGADIVSWGDTQIVCQVPAGASSGDTSHGVRVITSAGPSNDYPFTVTFSYSGLKWFGSNPMGETFEINANTADTTVEWQAVIDAIQAWNDVDNANFYFEYGGLTTATDYSKNGHNEIMWVNYDTGSIATAFIWTDPSSGETIECDIRFNDLNYTWYANGTPSGSQMDVQNIATHELGHWFTLLDLYGSADSEKTMYGFGANGETKKRTLESDDIAGMRWIYPGTGTRGEYHIQVTNNDDDDLTVYFKSDTDAGYEDWRRVDNVLSGTTRTSFRQVVSSGSHRVSIKWTDPDKGTDEFQTSDWLYVPVEGDTEFTFIIETFTIMATAGPGGTIDPSGAVTVNYGQDQTFTITPDTGYHIDDVLVDGVSVEAVSEYTFTSVTADHTIHATFAIEKIIVPATVDIDPDTLNLQSAGKWITAYIEMPGGYDVRDIDGSTVLLNGAVPAYLGKEGWAKAAANDSNIMDHDGDGILERMVKFDWEAVQLILSPAAEVEMTVKGEIAGVAFEGIDIIRVIDEGQGNAGKGKQ